MVWLLLLSSLVVMRGQNASDCSSEKVTRRGLDALTEGGSGDTKRKGSSGLNSGEEHLGLLHASSSESREFCDDKLS